jgi:carboxymethylenebutenolidase
MGEMVTFRSNGQTADGYLALPAAGSGPGVIVVQEWWGLVPHIVDMADRFAAEGFVALAPDLYHGERATGPDEAKRLMMSMDMGRAARDLGGGVQLLLDHPAVTAGPVGVVGFCLGGGLALFLASVRPEVEAAVTYYGVLRGAQPDLRQVRAEVLGHFGEEDGSISAELRDRLLGQLRDAGVKATFHVYPAGHAFANDTRPEAHAPGPAREAWDRTVAFLAERLGRRG